MIALHNVTFQRGKRSASALECSMGHEIIIVTEATCTCGWRASGIDHRQVQMVAATHDLDEPDDNACGQP